MQALNLRSEPVAPQKPAEYTRTSQGLSSSKQDESSFDVALKKAKNELDDEKSTSTQEKLEENVTKPKEGNKKNISQNEAQSDSELLCKEDMSKEFSLVEKDLNVENKTAKLETTEFSFDIKDFLTEKKDDSKDLEGLKKKSKIQKDTLGLNTLDISELSNMGQKKFDEKISLLEKDENQLDNSQDVSQELLNSILVGNNQSSNESEIKNLSFESQDISNVLAEESAKLKLNSKEKQQPLISVVDERTVVENANEKNNFVTSITSTGENSAQMTMDFSSNVQQNIQFEGVVNSTGKTATEFSAMLSTEIQNNANEFVKAGSIVLKDNNSGTINLILHPDELGSVKIQLELSDKLIAGKIVVATKEAYDAFNSSMNALKEAFNSSGFETSNFDLSWSGNESSSNSEDNRNFHGFDYEKNINQIVEDDYGKEFIRDTIMYGSSLINMMA